MSKLQIKLKEIELVLCHNDLHLGNILVQGQDLFIIDYEFSQFNYLGYDLGNFFNEWATHYGEHTFLIDEQAELPLPLKNQMIRTYFNGLKEGYPIKGQLADWQRYVKLGRVLSHLMWMIVGLKQINDKRIGFNMVDYISQREINFHKQLELLEKM